MERINYILKDKTPVACSDIIKWGKWFSDAKRRVADDRIGKIRVSTVFIGIDHNFGFKGPPLLFETMIFGGKHDGYQERYSTWEEAEIGHKKALAVVGAYKP